MKSTELWGLMVVGDYSESIVDWQVLDNTLNGTPTETRELRRAKFMFGALPPKPFLDLKLMFVESGRTEQLNLHLQQRIVTTVEDSVLRTEMSGLESQEEDVPKCILFFKPMSSLGQIRVHRRDEA